MSLLRPNSLHMAHCRFMSKDCSRNTGETVSMAVLPLYSMPHFNLTMICWPVRSLRKGLGLTGTFYGGNVLRSVAL